MRVLTVTLALSSTVLSLGVLNPAAGQASAAAPTCQGMQATIVGSPSQPSLEGTQGDDVVVSNGSSRVQTGGGDDLVCVTGRPPRRTTVNAGEGDDSIVVKYQGTYPVVHIGPGQGSDTVVGGSGPEKVISPPELDEVDVIDTHGGADFARLYDQRHNDTTTRARVDLGGGDDSAVFREAIMAPDAELDGGDGADDISFYALGSRTDRLDVDAASGATFNTLPILYWTDIDSFDFISPAATTFTGTDGPDDVHPIGTKGGFSAQMTRGDDQVDVSDVTMGSGGAVVDVAVRGGSGRDLLTATESFDRYTRARINLASGNVLLERNDVLAQGTATGFEDVTAHAVDTLVKGDDGPNRIDVACAGSRTQARGRGGADVLLASTPPTEGTLGPCDHGVDFRGGDGSDRLVGNLGPDKLIGGAGRDTAVGLGGRDRCVAEVRRSC